MEVERTMTSELQRLKQEMRERGHARPQDEEIINALREQVRNSSIPAHSDICMALYTIKVYTKNSPALILAAFHACLFIK